MIFFNFIAPTILVLFVVVLWVTSQENNKSLVRFI